MFHVYAVSSRVCRRMSRSRTWGHCVVSSFCFPLYSPETGSFAAKLAWQQMPSVLCLSSSQCWDWVHAHTWLRCCGSHHLSHLPSPHSGFDLHFTNGLPEVFVLFCFFTCLLVTSMSLVKCFYSSPLSIFLIGLFSFGGDHAVAEFSTCSGY